VNQPFGTTSGARLAARDRFTVEPRTVVLITILAAVALAVFGSLSEVSLGDENVHVRHAAAFTTSWHRPAFDPASVFPDGRDRLPCDGTPLWHMGLALLWRLAGCQCPWLAQAYQAAFYALLALTVYFGARRLWDDSAAAWAWLIVVSMPMICAYGIVLYQDVPGVAVSALGLWLLWRRNFLAAGVALALAYMTKMNMLSFGPWAAVMALWWADGSWKRRLGAMVTVALPIAAVFAGDLWWRSRVYEYGVMGPAVFPDISMLTPPAREALSHLPTGFVIWKPFPFYGPVSIISHLGPLALAGIVAALWRGWDVASHRLWVGVLFTAFCFYAVFVRLDSTQIRYLLPTILLLAILGGGALRHLRLPRWLLIVIIAGCAVQVLATSAYMTRKRDIPSGEREAYAWIRDNAAPGTRIMFPEEGLTNWTGRRASWGALNPANFTTEMDDSVRKEVLNFLSVSHIAVPRRRIYDPRAEGIHHGGYPRAFVEHARQADYLETVFENDDVVIFRYTQLEPIGPTAPPDASRRTPGTSG